MIVAMEKPLLSSESEGLQGQSEGCLCEYEQASKADEINTSQTAQSLLPLPQDSDFLIDLSVSPSP